MARYGAAVYGQSWYGSGDPSQSTQSFAASLYTIAKFGDPFVYNLSTVTRKIQRGYVKYGKEQQLDSGRLVRDITAVKRTFQFHWDYLPHFDNDTLDGGIGYVTLYTLYQYGINAGENNGLLTLTIPDGKGGQTSMTCYIGQSTKASLNRIANPQTPNATAYWSVDLELVEV